MLAAVTQNMDMLLDAPKKLQANQRILLAAMSQDRKALQCEGKKSKAEQGILAVDTRPGGVLARPNRGEDELTFNPGGASSGIA